MKHHPIATANAAGMVTAIVFVVCRIAVNIVPDFMFSMAQSWLHGIELTKLSSWQISAPTFFLGLVSSTVTAWLIGYLFAVLYNSFLKK